MSTILDGKPVAERVKTQIKERAALFLKRRGRKPGLAVVLVGEDPGSQVYVRNKIKACAECGMESIEERLPRTASADQIKSVIERLNQNKNVDAMIVQLPLPEGLDKDEILATIDPRKDADGLLGPSLGQLVLKLPGPISCTPNGVMKILEYYQIPLKGAEAVVVGRSQIVGLPMMLLLQQANATVTLCHSGTKDLKVHTSRADIVVAALGKPKFLGSEHFKKSAVVIDVGIHRLGKKPDGKEQLCGDVDFAAVQGRVSAITPVPGGVGVMTIAMLLENTIGLAEKSQSPEPQ